MVWCRRCFTGFIVNIALEDRDGCVDREEGIALVKKYDEEFPSKFYKEFLEYVDITEDEFNQTVDNFRSPHLWEKIDNQWKLKFKIT